MRFRKTLNRRINEDYENLERFFEIVKKHFKKLYNIRTSGIPGGGASITLEAKSPIFGIEGYNITFFEDPADISDFSRSIGVNITACFSKSSEKGFLRQMYKNIDEMNEELLKCKDEL